MLKTFTTCTLMVILFIEATTAQRNTIPHLEKRGKATQLIVNGEPFLVLGGELLNSSTSSARYMKPLWPKLKAMHLNTALAAVSWELIEPEEGKFDFSLVDSMIDGARTNRLRLILLWFGSWKNGLSHYTPAWVKKDFRRFPLMHIKGNKPVEALTPLSIEAMQADARAFAALMKHLKETDSDNQTVIMIQVENEVGLIGGPRDLGEVANKTYTREVPKALTSYMQKNKDRLLPELRQLWSANGFRTGGTWGEMFGNTPAAEEAFMAWHYAAYINTLVEAGKAEYALPMFVNAWIVQPEDLQPGDYPSGGPQAHLHDIWRAGAPLVDLLSPDIYLPDFDVITALYTRSDNALFIPESRGGHIGAANAFYAFGQHRLIGYSPFGIDRGIDTALSGAYAILQQLAPQILSSQANGSIAGCWLNPNKVRQSINLNGYILDVSLRRNARNTSPLPALGYGLILATGPDEFIIAGKEIQINFYPSGAGPAYVGYTSVEDGVYVDGKWVAGRRLNGDDIMHNYSLAEEAANQRTGTVIRLRGDAPGIVKAKLYRFE